LNEFTIEEVLEEFYKLVQKENTIVLEAPPGAGKTTMIPQALLRLLPQGKQIYLIEPRRIAAKNAALRISNLLGEQIGRTVGYMVRFEKKVSSETKIIVMTDGIFLQILQNHPDLSQVYAVILDEFHERSINLDLSLALTLEIQKLFNSNLKLIIMSATLNSEMISNRLNQCAILKSEGKIFPLEIKYFPVSEVKYHEKVRKVLLSIKEEGDILVFLPGKQEILKTKEILEETFPNTLQAIPLYGDLSLDEQTRALFPLKNGKRRVVLSTNLAESSITIEGVNIVIDLGYAKEMRFQSGTSMSRLETIEIAMDSADQRAGRAARTAPGVCYRIWDNTLSGYREKFTKPEILRTDLSNLVLECYRFGVNPEELTWITEPTQEKIHLSRNLLKKLGIINENHTLTEKGSLIVEFPLHPRIGNMLYEARKMGLFRLSYQLAAVLSEKDFLKGNKDYGSDLYFRVQALEKKTCPANGDESSFRKVQKIYQEFLKSYPPSSTEIYDTKYLGILLSFAYPERIARIREIHSHKYKLATGKTAYLSKDDPLKNEEFIVVADTDGSNKEAQIYLTSSIKKEEIVKYWNLEFQTVSRINLNGDKVQGIQEVYYGEILISITDNVILSQKEKTKALTNLIREERLSVLHWTEEASLFIKRITFLRENGLNYPDCSVDALLEDLEHWLVPSLDNIKRISELKQIPVLELLKARCTYEQLQILEKEAPTHFKVPSGSRVKIDYTGINPVLQVKLQEVFGLMQTPRLAGGKVPLLFELLSPAMRPVQKTQDLKSFWTNTYPEVRKELKGRYPKHPWPENPLEAEPTKYTRNKAIAKANQNIK
jgi:ATP-dependent helicase HrpB